jgi:hypothetical protein
MTEAEWLRSKTLRRIVNYLIGKTSDRKHWLFVASFWRNGRSPFLEEMREHVAYMAELLADDLVLPKYNKAIFDSIEEQIEFYVAEQDFENAVYLRDFREILFPGVTQRWRATYWGEDIALQAAVAGAKERGFRATRWVTSFRAPHLPDMLRDIIGNPFHRVTISSTWRSWNDGIVVRLAQAAYDECILPAGALGNTRLLILADALEEAGCTDGQILTHLRSGGEHYRGCWVLDALLGRS